MKAPSRVQAFLLGMSTGVLMLVLLDTLLNGMRL